MDYSKPSILLDSMTIYFLKRLISARSAEKLVQRLELTREDGKVDLSNTELESYYMECDIAECRWKQMTAILEKLAIILPV